MSFINRKIFKNQYYFFDFLKNGQKNSCADLKKPPRGLLVEKRNLLKVHLPHVI